MRVDLDTMRNTSRKIFALRDVASLCAGSAEGQPPQTGENMSPPAAGTTGPAGTMSSAIIVEGTGVDRTEPVTHWIAYHFAAPGNRLREHQPTQARLDHGALQGLTFPPAEETHPDLDLLDVFALNTRLSLDPVSAERKDVVNAKKGHVVASGGLVVNSTGQ